MTVEKVEARFIDKTGAEFRVEVVLYDNYAELVKPHVLLIDKDGPRSPTLTMRRALLSLDPRSQNRSILSP